MRANLAKAYEQKSDSARSRRRRAVAAVETVALATMAPARSIPGRCVTIVRLEFESVRSAGWRRRTVRSCCAQTVIQIQDLTR
jgi:hypothetical protein